MFIIVLLMIASLKALYSVMVLLRERWMLLSRQRPGRVSDFHYVAHDD